MYCNCKFKFNVLYVDDLKSEVKKRCKDKFINFGGLYRIVYL